MAKGYKIQIDLNRIDAGRIKHKTRRNGEEAAFYDIVAIVDDVPNEFGNVGEAYEKLHPDEHKQGVESTCLGYVQPVKSIQIRKSEAQGCEGRC